MTGADPVKKEKTQRVLYFVLEKTLRLLHPFAPFISEEIWNKLKEQAADKQDWPESLSWAGWPSEDKMRYENKDSFFDTEAERLMNCLQRGVGAIRDLRASLNIPPSQPLEAVVLAPENSPEGGMFKIFETEVKRFGKLDPLKVQADFQKSKSWLGRTFPDFEIFIRIEGLVDPDKEGPRLEKEITAKESYIRSVRGKIANADFVKNAPAEIVEAEREKLADAEKVLKSHRELLALFR